MYPSMPVPTRIAVALAVLLLMTGALALPALAQTPSPDGDDKITGQTFVRHDGGTDAGIAECNNGSSGTAPDAPGDGDGDSNDGGNRRQGNEPFVVIDPTDPDVVLAGWNDYCLTDLNAGWEGLAYSLDSGETWVDSLVPGYPQDTSTLGQQSPLYGRQRFAGDPIAAFNTAGDLYVGGIAFNRAGAINGDVFVATYDEADQASGYPVTYVRTRIVGRGTPSRNFFGIFQDKPMLEVDRTGGDDDGNVYVCWSRFVGAGRNKIYFSRSTDGGNTFSRPVAISGDQESLLVQGCDIAVEHDGDVYVTWRTFALGASPARDGLAFARSTDGGASFGRAERIRSIVPYFPFDGSRDCGDGPEHCPADFVFHRVPLEPRVTADQAGTLPGVYLTYNEIRPGSSVASETSYSSAGSGRVGQSLVYVLRTTDDGASWSAPVAVDANATGHQYFPDVDALDGTLAVVWQDSRTDTYSVQRPFGNVYDATGRAVSSGTTVITTRFAYSTTGTSFTGSTGISTVAHQPQYEMFGGRQVPFQGDYNWVSLAQDGTSLFAYMAWTDNRDVVPATAGFGDVREGFDDGFDVHQCRADAAAPDTCPNAGGLDQNIYGTSVTFP
jgi:hypothetical protein